MTTAYLSGTARAGAPIRHLRSVLVPVDEAAFCLIRASSADRLRPPGQL